MFIIVIVGLIAYPYVTSTLTWLLHRSVTYRGSAIPLPFRWTYDSDGTPLSIEKPSWTLGMTSELSIIKLNLKANDQQKILDRWTALQRALHPQYPVGSASDTFTDTNGRSLLCFEDVPRLFVTMHCISRDAAWVFNYVGSARDARDINKTVQYLIAHQEDFR